MRATAPSNKHIPSRRLSQATAFEESADAANIREPASLQALLDLCRQYMPPADLTLIRSAYTVAAAAHAGTLRKSGEPYIEHPLAVARILAELAIDAQGIAAALLHDTVEDTSMTLEHVQEQFGPVIAAIVDGVTKFTAVREVSLPDSASTQANAPVDAGLQRERKARQRSETVRKLFLAMEREPRAVLLKLADRLHNMRTLESMSLSQRERIARETLDIFAPLAGRIGLHLVKTELEDLAFYFLEPEAFARTEARLRDEAMKRQGWAERQCEAMRDVLAASGVQAVVNWRVKHPYRAYKEAQESGMDVALLHDLIAFRVLVNETSESYHECYLALEAIHRLWRPYDGRIHDYIAHPKVNGYQSLHTAVFGFEGRLSQIHIRTHRMHRAAQHGVATYWLERAARGAVIDQMQPLKMVDVPQWIKQLSTWQEELGFTAADFEATLRGDLLFEQVFVFTPKGDIRELPEGSTVLDLAYQIHTDIGAHTIGAQVQTNTRDGLLVTHTVPVSYVLQRGDVVNILTSPDARPSLDWRNIARTRYAREKIARSLRLLQREDERYQREAELRDEPTAESEPDLPPRLLHPSGEEANVELARCCYPCPGDTIIGVARRGRGVTIHRSCCRIYRATLARRRAAGISYAEPLAVSWQEIQPITYRVYLSIEGQDHEGLMYEISRCAAQMGINVSGSKAYANQARYKAAVALTLDLQPDMRMENVIRRIQRLPGIVHVQRNLQKGCGEAHL